MTFRTLLPVGNTSQIALPRPHNPALDTDRDLQAVVTTRPDLCGTIITDGIQSRYKKPVSLALFTHTALISHQVLPANLQVYALASLPPFLPSYCTPD